MTTVDNYNWYDFDEEEEGEVEWSMDESEDRNMHDFVQDVYTGCYTDTLGQDTLKRYEDLRSRFVIARDSKNAQLAKYVVDQLNAVPFASLTECSAYSIVTEDQVEKPPTLFKFKSFKEYLVSCENLWASLYEGSDPGNMLDELIMNCFRCAMYNCWNLHTIHDVVYGKRTTELLWEYQEWVEFGEFLTICGLIPPAVNNLRQDKWVRLLQTRNRTKRINL